MATHRVPAQTLISEDRKKVVVNRLIQPKRDTKVEKYMQNNIITVNKNIIFTFSKIGGGFDSENLSNFLKKNCRSSTWRITKFRKRVCAGKRALRHQNSGCGELLKRDRQSWNANRYSHGGPARAIAAGSERAAAGISGNAWVFSHSYTQSQLQNGSTVQGLRTLIIFTVSPSLDISTQKLGSSWF